MTVTFSIKTNAIEAEHFFDSLSRSQLPFAISRAINRMAYAVKGVEQESIAQHFNTRTNWLTKSGAMPIIPSKKSQHPNIYAILGVKDEVAALAITGGERTGNAMAVPFSDSGDDLSARSILNPGRETLPPNKWPGAVVKERTKKTTNRRGRAKNPKPFYLKSKTGRSFVALRSSASKYPLRFLYGFEDKVEVPKLWPLVENVETFVAAKYGPYLEDAIRQAVKTAKF